MRHGLFLIAALMVLACSQAPATPSAQPSAPAAAAPVLRPAPANLGCDAMGVSYRSARIEIDGAAADPVTAVTDDGKSLRTYWSQGFSLGLANDAVADWVVRDPAGQVIAGDGETVDIPEGAWPRLHGYFVCPSTDSLYILLQDPT
jgi:hypothetical protein